MRTTLVFRKGKPGGSFVWVSHLNTRIVGLCRLANCPDCLATLSANFAGGQLEVIISEERKSRRSSMMFYTAHLAREEYTDRPSVAAVVPDDHASFETDAPEVTAFVYTDKKTGQSIMIDCGAPPVMNREVASRIIQNLVAKYQVSGMVITHGHVDHWNHLPVDFTGPVHMAPLTSSYFHRSANYQGIRPMFAEEIFSPEGVMEVGPFKLRDIPTPHSVPQTSTFLGTTSDGRTFLHQGDAKLCGIHWREEIIIRDRLAQIGGFGGVDVFHVDNLNCHRPGFTPEESEVCRSVSRIIAANTSRIIIGVFATNLKRIKAIAQTALDLGRRVEFAGSGMRFAKGLLEDDGMVFPSYYHSNNPTVVFTSGCQAEPESVLWREAEGLGSPAQLKINEQDLVILSSHRIPGNEEGIANMVTKLAGGKGCKVILHEGEISSLGINSENVQEDFTHCSGHGHREDVKTAIELVKPRAVIPSVRRNPQMDALREICRELGVAVLEPEENHFVL